MIGCRYSKKAKIQHFSVLNDLETIMRKITLLVITLICAAFLAMNAFAASIYGQGSLYQAGNIAIGGGYAGSSYSISGTGSGSGFMGQLSYFIMDDLSIGGQYYTSTFNGGGAVGNVTEAIIGGNITIHSSFSNSFGYYATLGYGSSTFTFPAGTSFSGGGFMAGLGLEGRFSPNIIGFAGIKSISANNGAVTTGKYSNVGFDVGLNLVF